MITITAVSARVSGLQRRDLEHWIREDWVRPDWDGSAYLFHEIDVARVRLIQDLREQMDIDEIALPLVLSLLDQVYELRRRMRQLGEAICETASNEVQQALADRLARPAPR